MKTQLTIADYINRYQAAGTGSRDRSVQTRQQQNGSFEDILSAVRKDSGATGRRASHSAENKGLTLRDYLKNPVRMPIVPTKIPAKNAQANTEESAGPEANDKILKDGEPSAQNNETGGIRQKIDACIAEASQKYDVSEEIIRGIVRAESGFRPDVTSPAGAQGLMQLMPGTAAELGVNDPFDIKENIDGGVRYFKQMMEQFDGDIKLSLAAYNAGPGTVRRYDGIPPYSETRQYVSKVIRFSKETA